MNRGNTDTAEIKQIQTIKPGGGRGIKIHPQLYTTVARAIFQHVRLNDEVTIVDLLSRIESELHDLHKENRNFTYVALHVKLDLECRGYLKPEASKSNPEQVQKCIGITKRGWTYFNQLGHDQKLH